MKALLAALVFVTSVCLLVEAPNATAQSIQVNTSAHNHRFEYWGTSLSWWANEVGGQTNAQNREDLVDIFFDPTNGLGMNMVRYNIGAGSNPDTSIQNITRPGAKMEGWVPAAPTSVTDTNTWVWNWNADANQRRILDMAIAHGVTNVEAFSNSAPWWMTRNLKSNGATGGGQNLSLANEDEFAHYVLEVVDHFKENLGIQFETLSPMNEPGSGFWNGSSQQEGMGVPAGFFQSGLINEFGAQIRNRGTNIKLVGLEETSTSNSASSWSSSSFTDTAKANLKQVNTHSYGFNGGSTETDSVNLFNAVNADNLGLKIYATEYGTGQGAVRLATQINRDIRHLDAAGWTYWQAIEDNNGSGWGLAISNFNGNNNLFDVQDQYFAYKQFSSYIRPGSEILELTGQDHITAAYDPRTGITALVVTNDGADGTSLNYSFNLDRSVLSTRLIRTSDENNASLRNAYQSLGAATVSGNNVSFATAGNAITTLAIHHRPNLVQNPNFNLAGAANGAASIPNWQSQGNAKFDTGNNLSSDTSGTGRLETGGLGNSGRLFQTGIGGAETDLTGKAFQLSADVRFLNLGSRNYDADTYLALEFYGANDQTLASTSLYQTEIKPAFAMKGADNESSVVGSAPNDSEYRTYRSERFVAPAGTRYVRPVIRFANAAGTDYTFVDNVYLGEVHPEADAREWRAEGGGTWSDTDNWSNNASVEKNSHAYFGNAINQASEVAVTDKQSIDGITFFSDHVYHLRASGANGRLEIGNAGLGQDAMFDVRWGSHRISTATTVFSDLDLQVLSGASLQIDNGFDANGKEIRKLGAGMVDFALGFDLNGGTLAAYASKTATITLGSDAILEGNYELLIAPGQFLRFGDAYELAAYSSLNDSFDNFILPSLSAGLA